MGEGLSSKIRLADFGFKNRLIVDRLESGKRESVSELYGSGNKRRLKHGSSTPKGEDLSIVTGLENTRRTIESHGNGNWRNEFRRAETKIIAIEMRP